MDPSTGWNHHDPTLASNGSDDFQQFLDMGMNSLGDDMQFDFQDFSTPHNSSQLMPADAQELLDTVMGGDMMSGKDGMTQAQMPSMATTQNMSTMPNSMLDMGQDRSGSMAELDAQIQFLQQQRQQQQQRQMEEQQRQQQYFGGNPMVPPTPNSIEMHSANQQQQYYTRADSQQQAMFENYQLRLKEQELAFTPLVSPAVTPLETHFSIGDYTVPGAYFSPLSSPALHAQADRHIAYDVRMNGPSVATSPIEMNIDLNAAPGSVGPTAKRSTKKAPARPKSRSVRQSPIVKPQRRKGGSSTTLSPQTLLEVVEPALQLQAQHQARHWVGDVGRSGASTTDGSENASISPEPLSEMAPPPLPRSAMSSPFLTAQGSQSRVQQLSQTTSISPATPASLMRLATTSNQTSPSLPHSSDLPEDHQMDGFALPEPANPARPSLSRIDTQASSGQTTPTLDATSSRTSAFALPSPSLKRPQSTKSSPALLAQASSTTSLPASAASTPSVRKTPLLAVRGSGPPSTGPTAKKRSSVSSNSVLISPALRPRISPSIKPLIRNANGSISSSTPLMSGRNLATMDDDTASLLLASKSNYQNILEGTHLPGVSYPSELSTNLTSKRTSHKLAEQGRRNRINNALAEMSLLLPKKATGKGRNSSIADGAKEEDDEEEEDAAGAGGKDKDKEKGVQSANSKASTVENAIEYIKALRLELETMRKRADEAEKKLEAVEATT